MRWTLRACRLALLAGWAVLMVGCGGEDSTAMPELDLAAMRADTDFGIIEAHRAPTSYTARLGEGRAIGIAFLEELGIDDRDGQLAVQLYDGDLEAVLLGEIDGDGAARLVSGELSDFEASIELDLDDAGVSGTVTFADEQPQRFTVPTASGTAGVYWARGNDDHPDVTCDWVVLADGSQWGCICFPPFTSPCCEMQF